MSEEVKAQVMEELLDEVTTAKNRVLAMGNLKLALRVDRRQ